MSNEFGAAATKKEPMLPAWLKVLLGIVGVVLFLLLVGWFVLDVTSASYLEAELAQIEALGWPIELADLYPQPIPEAENAATIYAKVFGNPGNPPGKIYPVESPEEWVGLSQEEQAQIRDYLDASAPDLKLLHQATQLPACQFSLNYRASYNMLLPHLAELRWCLRLQTSALIVALADGRIDDALEQWLDAAALVKHQEGQQILISELVRVSCLSMALNGLENMVESGQLTPAHIDRALAALRDIEGRESFVRGMKGELVLGNDIFDEDIASLVGAFGGNPPKAIDSLPSIHDSVLCRPWRQHDEATHLALLRQCIQLGEQPHYQSHMQLQQWETRVSSLTRWKSPFSAMLLPALTRAWTALTTAEAQVACARTALALERYRLTHGDYPATLDSLVPGLLPQVPVDPFDGKPVRYINDGERVVVYSVGEDLRDDGGPEDARASRQPLDIVFTVRRPAAEATEESTDDR